jgi:hypothetical protein
MLCGLIQAYSGASQKVKKINYLAVGQFEIMSQHLSVL